jgi:tellurite resistance protein
MLDQLNKRERLLLLQFVCAFAWADLEVKKSERDLVHRLVTKLRLEPDEKREVEQWLKRPPKPEDVDPNRIPRAHRELFLEAARQMIAIDGEIDPAERENLDLLEQLLA